MLTFFFLRYVSDRRFRSRPGFCIFNGVASRVQCIPGYRNRHCNFFLGRFSHAFVASVGRFPSQKINHSNVFSRLFDRPANAEKRNEKIATSCVSVPWTVLTGIRLESRRTTDDENKKIRNRTNRPESDGAAVSHSIRTITTADSSRRRRRRVFYATVGLYFSLVFTVFVSFLVFLLNRTHAARAYMTI